MISHFDQLQRAGITISNNIAEGSVGSAQNFKRYLMITIGSTLETTNILIFAYEIKYVSLEKKNEMYEKAEKLIRKIRNFSKSIS